MKINHTDKCLWYFHPSYGCDNREITAESQKIYSYPYYLSVLLRKPDGLKIDNVNSCFYMSVEPAVQLPFAWVNNMRYKAE